VLLLAGVHPNCESMTLLISDGQRYRGVNHYLKKPFSQVVVELAALSKKIEPKLDRLDRTRLFQRLRGQWLCLRTFVPWALRSIDFVGLGDGKPLRALAKLVFGSLFRRQSVDGPASGRRPRRVLRLGMLPFEEQHSVDAARMESCKAVFAYEDPDDGQVKTIPACLWYPYRNPLLEQLSKKYGIADSKKAGNQVPAGGSA
jgi:hypothetical protein